VDLGHPGDGRRAPELGGQAVGRVPLRLLGVEPVVAREDARHAVGRHRGERQQRLPVVDDRGAERPGALDEVRPAGALAHGVTALDALGKREAIASGHDDRDDGLDDVPGDEARVAPRRRGRHEGGRARLGDLAGPDEGRGLAGRERLLGDGSLPARGRGDLGLAVQAEAVAPSLHAMAWAVAPPWLVPVRRSDM
jgi:hypothetical protein